MSPPKAIPGNVPDLVAVKRALISVSDKTGLVERARKLVALGVDGVCTNVPDVARRVLEDRARGSRGR